MPVTQDANIPTITLKETKDEFEMTCGSLSTAAPRIMGVDSKNENLTAPSPVTPINNAVLIVMPERETPGIIATACDTPINKLDRKVIWVISIFLALLRSAQYRRMPINMSMMAIRVGDLNIVSAFFSRRNPPIAPGTLAATRYQNNLPSVLRRSVKPLIMSRRQSFQK